MFKLILVFFQFFIGSTFSYFADELVYISMSAREKALGSRYVADIEAVTSNMVNVSLIPFNVSRKIFFNYNKIYEDIMALSLGYIFPYERYGFLISFTDFDLGKILVVKDEQLTEIVDEKMKAYLYNVAVGYKFKNNFSIGLHGRYFDSRFLNFDTSFFVINGSLFYSLNNIKLGGVIENLYSKEIKLYNVTQRLKPTVSIGMNYNYTKVKNIDELNFELDFVRNSFNFSMEAKVEKFAFRVGYDAYIKNIGLGIGFIYKSKLNLRIDYSYNFSILEEKYKLSNLHTLSLVIMP